MIVVKVEMWPGGDAEKAEPLGVLMIENTGKLVGSPLFDEPAEPDHFYYNTEVHDYKRNRRPERQRITHYRRRGWQALVRKAVEVTFR